jgi:hypothetical protein
VSALQATKLAIQEAIDTEGDQDGDDEGGPSACTIEDHVKHLTKIEDRLRLHEKVVPVLLREASLASLNPPRFGKVTPGLISIPAWQGHPRADIDSSVARSPQG